MHCPNFFTEVHLWETTIANVVVTSRRNPQQKQSGRLDKKRKTLVDNGQKLCCNRSFFCTISGYCKMAEWLSYICESLIIQLWVFLYFTIHKIWVLFKMRKGIIPDISHFFSTTAFYARKFFPSKVLKLKNSKNSPH